MKITRLGHNDTYTVMNSDGCYTFFDEAIPHGDSVELRAHTYVSGAIYGDKITEFLKLWEEMQ